MSTPKPTKPKLLVTCRECAWLVKRNPEHRTDSFASFLYCQGVGDGRHGCEGFDWTHKPKGSRS